MTKYRGGLKKDQVDEIETLMAEGVAVRAIARGLQIPYGQVRTVAEAINLDVMPAVKPMRAVVADLETSGLKSDIGMLKVASFLDLATGKLSTRSVLDFGGLTADDRERELLLWWASQYEQCDIIIGHNFQGYDKNFTNGVLARHGMSPLPKRILIDTYQVARHGWKGIPQSYSLENLMDFFGVGMSKDKPDKADWRLSLVDDPEAIARLTQRCEYDVIGNALLWGKLKPFYYEWRGR